MMYLLLYLRHIKDKVKICLALRLKLFKVLFYILIRKVLHIYWHFVDGYLLGIHLNEILYNMYFKNHSVPFENSFDFLTETAHIFSL